MVSEFKSRRAVVGLPALLIAGLAFQDGAVAQERGGVGNLISDLYGGDGLVAALDPSGHHPEIPSFFEPIANPELFDLSDDITRGLALAPFNSTATSIVFDIEAGVPVRAADSLGPLLLQRATTIGRNRVNVGFSYTRIDYDQFEGDDLDDLTLDVLSHTDCCPNPPQGDDVLGPPGAPTEFELDQVVIDLDLELQQDVFAFFGTYGITDNWDVGAVVPIVHIDGEVRSVASIIDRSPTSPVQHQFDRSSPDPDVSGIDSNSEEATGIGDVLLRTKYNFLNDQPVLPDAAVLGQLSLPTGDEDDLLGTGETGVLGLLIASKDFGRVTANGNIGYEVFTGDFEDNLRYGAGFDVMVTDTVTGAAEVLGRYETDGDGTGDVVDLAFGAKWNPLGNAVLSTVFLVPINKDTGLRSDFIWGVGFDITFGGPTL